MERSLRRLARGFDPGFPRFVACVLRVTTERIKFDIEHGAEWL
jgi:hypothetical protein